MATFDNVEVYVRLCDYGYEGESVRFATVNEQQALTYFADDGNEVYAPDSAGEELRVYVGGKYIQTWYRQNGKWLYPYYGDDQREYGVIKL